MLECMLIGTVERSAIKYYGSDGSFFSFQASHSIQWVDRQSGEVRQSKMFVSVTIQDLSDDEVSQCGVGALVAVRGNVSARAYTGNDNQVHAGLNMRAYNFEILVPSENKPIIAGRSDG